MREVLPDREGYVGKGNRKQKKGHQPERARLVSGEKLGMGKRTNDATLCKALFSIITATGFYLWQCSW